MNRRESIATALFLLVVLANPLAAQLTEFTIPTNGSSPWGITAGPDDNIWFTENFGNRIGKVTPTGNFTEYKIPTAGSFPEGITAGPDGNLWFVENGTNKIGSVTPSGIFAEYAIPTVNSHALNIAAGSDGNVWFSEFVGNRIGKVTPDGIITEFLLPTSNGGPQGISIGPDRNVWFTESFAGKVGRVTPDGSFTEYALPKNVVTGLAEITTGADGNLWCTGQGFNSGGNGIIKVTPEGMFTLYPLPDPKNLPTGIAAGPDGNVWFTQPQETMPFARPLRQVAEVTPDGVFADYAVQGYALDIVAGPDGNMWFTENGPGKIGRIDLQPTVTPGSTSTGTPLSVATATPTRTAPGTVLIGDCQGAGRVSIADLVTLVNIALGSAPASACPSGVPSGSVVNISLLIRAVSNALGS